MYEIDLDMIGPQTCQALVDRREDARPAAVSAVWHFLVADAEFGCDHDIVAVSLQRPRQRLFRDPYAIGFGGVEAGDADIDRRGNGALKFSFVDAALRAADFPAAKAHVLVFDENLAARLVTELADLYPGCAHVGDRGLTRGSDRAIWQYGRDHGLVVVTKDEDFQRFSILYGSPPKVIWIRLGNCSTADISRLLRERREAIARFSADEEAAFLGLAY
jgi:predicted nuclease of predicted toxin-antitoxin system